MSADILNKQENLPVWIVHGVNWHCEVVLNEISASLEEEHQMYDAASKALRAFKGLNTDCFLVMDEGETTPYLGHTMIVHRKDKPTQKFIPYTYVVLANETFYHESIEMHKKLEEEGESKP